MITGAATVDSPASAQLPKEGASVLSKIGSIGSASGLSGSSTPGATEASQTATPATASPPGRQQPLAPLPSLSATPSAGSGSSIAAAPYSSSSNPTSSNQASPAPAPPTQAAPRLLGGGGDTLEACMGYWDRATHMTKKEWRVSCQRTLHRLDDVAKEFAQMPSATKPRRLISHSPTSGQAQ
jgi:hypothetical protein